MVQLHTHYTWNNYVHGTIEHMELLCIYNNQLCGTYTVMFNVQLYLRNSEVFSK